MTGAREEAFIAGLESHHVVASWNGMPHAEPLPFLCGRPLQALQAAMGLSSGKIY